MVQQVRQAKGRVICESQPRSLVLIRLPACDGNNSLADTPTRTLAAVVMWSVTLV
jgi:hypothetical protein